MSEPNEIIAMDYVFFERELFGGLEWAEGEVGLQAIEAALSADRELIVYHLCLAHTPAFRADAKAALLRLGGCS